jgi:beta-N-acetylhexosaminidase
VAANRGSVSMEGGLNAFLNQMVHGPVPVALFSLGNPYLLSSFPDVSTYAAAFSTATTSESAVARAILGEIPISGKLPVSIPGIAKAGDGMDVAERQSTASNGSK